MWRFGNRTFLTESSTGAKEEKKLKSITMALSWEALEAYGNRDNAYCANIECPQERKANMTISGMLE